MTTSTPSSPGPRAGRRPRQRPGLGAVLMLAGLLAGCAGAAPADPSVPPASTAPAGRPRVIGPGSSQGIVQAPPPVAAPAASASGLESAHAQALARVEALAGPAPCQADTQCHTVALGARACGGPTSYRAWSDAITDRQAIEAAAAHERALAAEMARASGRPSICLFLADPGAQCVQGRCETRSSPTAPLPR